MILPRKAPPNATLAIISPGSKPRSGDLKSAQIRLREMGYGTIDYCSVGRAKHNDENRLESLEKAFKDQSAEVIIAARGGYGCLRLLDQLDYDLIKTARKILVGFSDITALSLAIYRKTRLITLSGPMLQTHFAGPVSRFTRDSFRDTIHGRTGRNYKYNLKIMGGRSLTGGTSSGILLGGNLSVLCRMVGSNFLPSFKGVILFLEDIGESQGRLDNLFAQLRLSGILDSINGAMLGYFSDCFRGNRQDQDRLMQDMLEYYFKPLKIPVVFKLPFGHEDKILTLPIGLPVRLEAGRGVLTFLEDVVR